MPVAKHPAPPVTRILALLLLVFAPSLAHATGDAQYTHVEPPGVPRALQPRLALPGDGGGEKVTTRHPNLGPVTRIVPALWRKDGLHFLVMGIQDVATIDEVVSFDGHGLVPWRSGDVPAVHYQERGARKPSPKATEAPIDRERLSGIEVAPMVRVTNDPFAVMMGELGIPTIKEMVPIGQLVVPDRGGPARNTLLQHLASYDGQEWMRSSKAQDASVILQVQGPHGMMNRPEFEQELFGDPAKDPRQTLNAFRHVALLAKWVGHDEINVNMCCPARAIVKKSGGVGMMHRPELAGEVVRTMRGLGLKVSAKILLFPSEADPKVADVAKTAAFAKTLAGAGLDRLYVQAHPGGTSAYDVEAVKAIQRAVPEVRVVYNGEIGSLEELAAVRETLGARDAPVAVGRGFLGHPRHFLEGSAPSDRQLIDLALKQSHRLNDAYFKGGRAGLTNVVMGLTYVVTHLSDRCRAEVMSGLNRAKNFDEVLEVLERARRNQPRP